MKIKKHKTLQNRENLIIFIRKYEKKTIFEKTSKYTQEALDEILIFRISYSTENRNLSLIEKYVIIFLIMVIIKNSYENKNSTVLSKK